MKWTNSCDALVDFVEEHGGSMGGETRDHLFNIVQNIVDGQSVLETPPPALLIDTNTSGFPASGVVGTTNVWPVEPVPAPPEDRYVGKIKGHVQTLRTVIEEGGETYTPEGMVIFLRTLLRDIEWLLDADPAPVPAPRTFNPFTKIESSPLTCVCGSSGEDCEREIEGRHGACCRHCVHLADQRGRSAAPVPAPRLEWREHEEHDAFVSAEGWTVAAMPDDQLGYPCWMVWPPHEHNIWTRRAIAEKLPSVDAAKSLAEKLNAVLSPPVGTQE